MPPTSGARISKVRLHRYNYLPLTFVLFSSIQSGGVGQGTLFSLRSRRQQDAYLSLELSAGGARLVHAGANGSEVIHLPATLKDYRWHQIAIRYKSNLLKHL